MPPTLVFKWAQPFCSKMEKWSAAATRRTPPILRGSVPSGWPFFWAGTHYPDIPIKAMAIAALKNGEPVANIAAPCGACRQVISESTHRNKTPFPLLLAGKNEVLKIANANDLLPLSFGPKDL